MKKVVFITEYLNPPLDEGIKKTASNLLSELDTNHKLTVYCRYGFEKDNITIIKTNALFLSYALRRNIRSSDTEVLIYLPFMSSTFASYLRMRVLRQIAKKRTKTIFIALQPKPVKNWQKSIIQKIKPEFALTPSPLLKLYWDQIGVENLLFPLPTNLSQFKPVEEKEKLLLRKKYNLPERSFIISHIGHLTDGRNLNTLINIQNENRTIIFVGSSSSPSKSSRSDIILRNLISKGVTVLNKYIENIEEVYQLSDAYIFPVIEKNSSIGLPLSILEARACGVPVVTTDYGSVKQFLNDDYGNIYYCEADNIEFTLKKLIRDLNKDRQKTNIHNLNSMYLDIINQAVLN